VSVISAWKTNLTITLFFLNIFFLCVET